MNLIPIECPQGWVSEKLGSLCGVFTTGKLDANAMVSDGDFPFFTCAREALRIDRYAFDDEALLVSGNGANVGYVHYYNGKFNAYQRTYVISNFSADVQYLKLFLENNLEERIRKEVNAGNTPYITMSTLTDMEVVLPSSQNEQRAIATALSDVDALIAGLERLIAKKRDIKQAGMQQLLTGQTRLPGFSGEWASAEVGEVAVIRNVKIVAASAPIGTKCVELESIGQGTGQLLRSFEAAGATPKYSFKPGDVLFGRLRAYLRKYCLATFDGICSTEIWPLIPRDDRLTSAYLYWVVQTEKFIDAAAISYGTHMPRSDWSVLKRLTFLLPSSDEQTAIATVLSDMNADLAALESRLAKTRAIKQGMMQELLTGRARLV